MLASTHPDLRPRDRPDSPQRSTGAAATHRGTVVTLPCRAVWRLWRAVRAFARWYVLSMTP
jgi:hypothetical protein